VDTYKPQVARAVLDAGAAVLNDYSGFHDPGLLDVVADSDAWYVLTHNPAPPKQKLLDPDHYGTDVTGSVIAWFDDRLDHLAAAGIARDRVVLDPGIDLSKTPAQSLTVLRELDRIRAALDLPLLLAISRKDVLGVLTGRGPAGRDPATLAVLDHVADLPATLARVHDVTACRDFLRVRGALLGAVGLADDAHLQHALRHEGR
jgi:dihydropteroate synthase